MIRSIYYRLWQFWRLLIQRLSPAELAQVQNWLPPSLFAVFRQMTPAEQCHAYCVWRTLKTQGQTDADLLIAALLHDVGKSRFPLAAWEKAVIVLGIRFAPRTAHLWGNHSGKLTWWTRPFVVARRHPAWSAEMVSAAGGSPLAVELIRRHQDQLTPTAEHYQLLSELQSADNNN